MANFVIRVILEPHPWPFRWGPFKRGGLREYCANGAEILIYQRGDGGVPVEVECFASENTGECTTTLDFRGGSRFKRRTQG